MGELMGLVQALPETFKWVSGILLAVAIVERLHGLYTKTTSERRARRKEELAMLSDLVGRKGALKDFCDENKNQEAFSRLTRLNVSKERRDQLLEITAMGFIHVKQVRMLEPFVRREDDGKYNVTIGLTELIMSLFGFVGIVVVTTTMLALIFASGKQENLLAASTLLGGTVLIFGIVFVSREYVQTLASVFLTSRRLNEKGLLANESGFKALVKQAWKQGWPGLAVLVATVIVMLSVGWRWGQSLKG
ncbi:hypothetical protein NH8B_1964 [Pseudogulbenkiania sp. NH8B]|uniref:hypothetical protein n=1 Tax=Pseudogulbenkiania sp. (strain NH8B) TaxID=748280 RepID=UPI00022798C3|nr:hypothetical protein [Pseudogulbenkiania sp. NH8B]BAK76779.1 hypothetical protein NH8B_1964 [Pseudogulbenkiania sp. NH8B]